MNKELEFLIKLVKNAEKIADKEKQVFDKGDKGDLVTNNDISIEEYMIKNIIERYPSFDIVSEEKNYSQKLTNNCFVIDPIDGTINYANGIPLYVIQVACIKNGEVVASVVSIPKLNELYYADESGAFLNGEQIRVNQVDIEDAIFCIDGSNNIEAIKNMRKHTRHSRNFGGVGISQAFVASGRIHGCVFRSEKAWDYLPGMFISKMAGAVTCDKVGFHASAMNEEFMNILLMEASKKITDSNVFILHSLNGDTLKYWGSDLKEYLTANGIKTFMPQFPIRAESSYEKFEEILIENLKNGTLNENSIVIAHSIGNPYFIRFCSRNNFIPKAFISVAPGAVYYYPSTRTDYIVGVKAQAYLNQDELNFAKTKLKNKICYYSLEEDKNLEKFERFVADTGAEGIFIDGYNHFDGYHKIYKFPEIREAILKLL